MGNAQFSKTAAGIFTVEGDFNYDTAAALWTTSKALLATAPSPIRIDLSGITHSDSAGVALLIAWLRSARQQKKTIQFLHLPVQITAILKVSGLETIFEVYNG